MTKQQTKALKNAAASSAMEGLALTQKQLQLVEQILSGSRSLAEYLISLQQAEQEA